MKRRVTVDEYKGYPYVHIREFYLDKFSNQLKPGSKGIALTLDNWDNLYQQVDFFFICELFNPFNREVEDINHAVVKIRERQNSKVV